MTPMSRTVLAALGLLAIAALAGAGGAESRRLRLTHLGRLPAARYALHASELVMSPGAEIAPHRHRHPGVRYVLEGAVTIVGADGGRETYRAGSTYFEGPAEGQSAAAISAVNPGPGPARILIVELRPE